MLHCDWECLLSYMNCYGSKGGLQPQHTQEIRRINSLCIYWQVCFCQLSTSKGHWREGTSIKKVTPSCWSVGKSLECLLD